MPALALARRLDRGHDRAGTTDEVLRLAFVNNMSDAALRQIERLFARLLDAAAGGLSIEVRPYRPRVLGAGGPPGEAAHGYAPLDELFEHGADAVVVTGAEPAGDRLTDEPAWPDLQRLFVWLEEFARPAFLSCLAAHAALLVYDGVERRRLPAKCSGVFPQQVSRHHQLGQSLPQTVPMPHSRYNDVPVEAVVGAGYEPVLHSFEVGWTIAARRRGRSLLLLAQGHPEYSATTLLREYRRDVGRYLDRARDELPVLPRRCVEGPKAVALRRFHERLASLSRSPALMDEFPIDVRSVHFRAPWASPAARLVHNWLSDVRVSTLRSGSSASAARAAERGRQR